MQVNCISVENGMSDFHWNIVIEPSDRMCAAMTPKSNMWAFISLKTHFPILFSFCAETVQEMKLSSRTQTDCMFKECSADNLKSHFSLKDKKTIYRLFIQISDTKIP